jgi:glycosyltransferase involved in cell wall biosynthesis
VKFSVVIPTHNRLDLLADAIESVRRQDAADWELVVFDNSSTDDIGGHVRKLADPRVRCSRSDEFLPVTDSWNRAIDLASGDYVIFLGDDDGLAPDYFSRMSKIIDQFQSPEVVYCAIYQFLHPGVAPWERRGYVSELRNGFFFEGHDEPFRLSREEVAKAVSGSLRLQRNFTFNIQAFVFSRRFLERLRSHGSVFRSPFPDYYLANIALAKAESTVIVPAPMSIAGVSKASFGFTLFNDEEERGEKILNAKLAADPLYAEVAPRLLPGPLYNTNYVLTMEHVARFAPEFAGKGVDYERYRRLQTFAVLTTPLTTPARIERRKQLLSQLGPAERLSAATMATMLSVGRVFRVGGIVRRVLHRLVGPYAYHPRQVIRDRGSYSRLIEVFDAIQNGALGTAMK